jgi:hypothetical protein
MARSRGLGDVYKRQLLGLAFFDTAFLKRTVRFVSYYFGRDHKGRAIRYIFYSVITS